MIENFKFKKQFGQNFITDTNLLESIVKDSGISQNDIVVEVGAGAGTLTEQIAKNCKNLISFEIDRDLKEYLTTKFKNQNNCEIVFCDALKLSNEEINKITKTSFHLIANLPYYITSPLIFKFLDNPYCNSLTIMIQKEVAQRIVAKPGTKDYGILSIKIGACAQVKICRIVSRKLFTPSPNVDSAIINIVKKETSFNASIFNNLVDKSFAMRRKTLQNNLVNTVFTKEEFLQMCQNLEISPSIRAEALSIEKFKEISAWIENFRQ